VRTDTSWVVALLRGREQGADSRDVECQTAEAAVADDCAPLASADAVPLAIWQHGDTWSHSGLDAVSLGM